MGGMRILLAVSAGLLLQAQAGTIQGTISCKTSSMTLVDTVAVWDPAKGELRVSLMPFKIQKKHLAEIQKDSTMFAVMDEKSPDPKKWKDCPGAEVKFVIAAKDLGKGADGVTAYHFWIHALEKPNFTDNQSQNGDGARKQLKKLVVKADEKGGTFELEFEGKSAFDDGVAWSVRAKGPVLPPAK